MPCRSRRCNPVPTVVSEMSRMCPFPQAIARRHLGTGHGQLEWGAPEIYMGSGSFVIWKTPVALDRWSVDVGLVIAELDKFEVSQ